MPSGDTPLHIAAAGGYDGVAQLLVKNGANVNAVNKEGWTPLHAASCLYSGGKRRPGLYASVVSTLAANRADLNRIGGPYGQTPLHLAVLSGELEVVQALVAGGADVNVRSADHLMITPLQETKYCHAKPRCADIARFLKEHGAHE